MGCWLAGATRGLLGATRGLPQGETRINSDGSPNNMIIAISPGKSTQINSEYQLVNLRHHPMKLTLDQLVGVQIPIPQFPKALRSVKLCRAFLVSALLLTAKTSYLRE